MSINNLEGYSVLERHSSPLTSTTVDYCALLFLLLSSTRTLKSLPKISIRNKQNMNMNVMYAVGYIKFS